MLQFQILSKVDIDCKKYAVSTIFPYKDNIVISFWSNYEEKYILKISENSLEKIVIENCDNLNLPKSDLRLLKFGDSFALLYKLKSLYLLDKNFQLSNLIEIQTEDNNKFSNFVSSFDIGIGDEKNVPLILCSGLDNYYIYFGVLYYDTFAQKAEIKKISLFDKDFFPKTDSDKFPFIKHLLLRNEFLYGFIEGSQNTKYLGQNYSNLFQSKIDGTNGKKLFEEDYSIIGDNKKRGKTANFTISKEYSIISPLYEEKKYDSWQGKQKLFSISHNELIDFSLPKGYSKLILFDHFNDIFWFKSFDKKEQIMTIYRGIKTTPNIEFGIIGA